MSTLAMRWPEIVVPGFVDWGLGVLGLGAVIRGSCEELRGSGKVWGVGMGR